MNIKFNFATQNVVNQVVDNQELAVMPAALAQKLLRIYAEGLVETSNRSIINQHREVLKGFAENNDLNGAILETLSWIAERDLIQNIMHENWDAYKVETKNTTEAVAMYSDAR